MASSVIVPETWEVSEIVSITDGDTLRIMRAKSQDYLGDGLETAIRDSRRHVERGVPIRLLYVNTPERSEGMEFFRAKDDLYEWLNQQWWAKEGRKQLMVTCYGKDRGGRILGDFWAGDVSNTASKYMMIERGWPAYIKK